MLSLHGKMKRCVALIVADSQKCSNRIRSTLNCTNGQTNEKTPEPNQISHPKEELLRQCAREEQQHAEACVLARPWQAAKQERQTFQEHAPAHLFRQQQPRQPKKPFFLKKKKQHSIFLTQKEHEKFSPQSIPRNAQ
jgi:hypothetical protein